MAFFKIMIRTIMLIFNLICLLSGILLITVGSAYHAYISYYLKKGDDDVLAILGVIIAIGVIIFVIAFLGCCGALRNNKCMLITYATSLIILFIIQLIIGIIGMVVSTNDYYKDDIYTTVEHTFAEYDKDEESKSIMQNLQSNFECCGVHGPTDYKTILQWTEGVAGGCCGKPDDDKCSTPIYTERCVKKIYDSLNKAVFINASINLGVCGLELMGAIVAICLVISSSA